MHTNYAVISYRLKHKPKRKAMTTTTRSTFRFEFEDCLRVEDFTRDRFRRELTCGFMVWLSSDCLMVTDTDQEGRQEMFEDELRELGVEFERTEMD